MKSAIYADGVKVEETQFKLEADFEKFITENYRLIFGEATIYFELKNKTATETLGGAIPDGFLFDFTVKGQPEFYMVEVELARHDFHRHIHPQITKFLASFNNQSNLQQLCVKLFNYVTENKELENRFRTFLSAEDEIFKSIKDIVENSKNILIIIDDQKPEFDEIGKVYSEWVKRVRVQICKRFVSKNKTVIVMSPDFQVVRANVEEEIEEGVAPQTSNYSESYHLEDASEEIKNLYQQIKTKLLSKYPDIIINPQKHYLSLKKKRNFAFFDIRRTKLRIVPMLPKEEGDALLSMTPTGSLAESVQKFYNGPCFQLFVTENNQVDEVVSLLLKAYERQK